MRSTIEHDTSRCEGSSSCDNDNERVDPHAAPRRRYAADWAAMQRAYGRPDAPKTAQEFHASMRQCHAARRRSEESEEEELLFYPPNQSYPGLWFYRLLCPTRPDRARRHIERVYWNGWSQLTHAMLLAGCGTILMAVGLGATWVCEERSRGVAVMIAALLLCIPGYYSLFLLFMYVCCRKGYSYTQLPE